MDKLYQSQIVEGDLDQVRRYVRGLTKDQLCGKGESCCCSICMAIDKGVSANQFEFGGQNLSVGEVRRAIGVLIYKTVRYRSVLLVAMSGLSNKSANSLLKLVEEPPLNTQIFLGVSTQWMLCTTILSRCSVERLSYGVSGNVLNIIGQSLEDQVRIVKGWDINKQLSIRVCEIVQALWEQDRFGEAYSFAKLSASPSESLCSRAEIISLFARL